MRNPRHLKMFVTVSLIASSICFLIVILQNLGLIPFLWNDTYRDNYQSFMSGTLGPNKVVVGISALMMSILSIALINTKSVTINKLLIYISLGFALMALAISGSRTAYLGLGVFVAYFAIRQPVSIIYSAFGVFSFLIIVSIADDLREANVGQLYEDLGAGRNEILIQYLDLLSAEYYFIPFGKGFNNRVDTASSAHNMYLSLIYEVGLVGMILYFRWLTLYLFVRMKRLKIMETALHGLVISMMVTLFFGEHLYIYRPLFALLGLFLFVVTILTSPIFLVGNEKNSTE